MPRDYLNMSVSKSCAFLVLCSSQTLALTMEMFKLSDVLYRVALLVALWIAIVRAGGQAVNFDVA